MMGGTYLVPVPGYPGVYVTPDGQVYRQLAVSPASDGYSTVTINGMKARRHLLMALAFLGAPPTARHEVRHLNGDPSDDDPENLAWGTRLENMADAIQHGTTTRGERNAAAKLTLAEAQLAYDRRKAGESVKSLALEFGVGRTTICDLAAGRTWPEVRR